MEVTDYKQLFFQKVQSLIEEYNLRDRTFHEKITKENVFQKAYTDYRDNYNEYMNKVIDDDSEIINLDNFIELHKLAKQGNSCLILSRHLSNFDVPNFYNLICKAGYKEYFDDIVYIAGRKLNEENNIILLLTSMFNRIVIIPKTEDDENATAINFAAQRKIREIKNKGKIILLFPTGTREKPWDSSTQKGIRETYNYINSFDYTILLNTKGLNLIAGKEGMLSDEITRDKIFFTFSEIYNSKELIKEIKMNYNKEKYKDMKQFVTDKIMEKIRNL